MASLEPRHIVRRLRGTRTPPDVGAFDPELASACLNLCRLTYLLPEVDPDPDCDWVPIEDVAETPYRTLHDFAELGFDDMEHFVFDGYFVKAVGVCLNNILLVGIQRSSPTSRTLRLRCASGICSMAC